MHPPRYICIHGHFYQPPRENPWLDVVEVQDSAAPGSRLERADHPRVLRPQHPRPAARRAGPDHQPAEQLRLDKLQLRADAALLAGSVRARRCCERIVEADRLSRERRGGHGNALAQVYNHVIMPLASAHDQSDAGALGHRRLPPSASAGIPRGCGWPRPPPTSPRSRRWPRRASASPSWPRTRPNAGGRPATRSGSRSREGSTPPAPTRPTPLGAIARAVLL